jgi:ABC-2 type transport system ATP-binding protein
MLKLTNVCKRYKNSDRLSVKNLSFEVKEGEIFGFLGKNGAGKSTSIKCITGILPFESGKIEICGHDIAKEPIECKLNIGYVPDNHAVYENLTGKEYVNYIANLYKVSKKDMSERLEKFVQLFNMSHAIDNQIRSYSHGMKQKICIIAALIHNPKLWVLDEPLMGLDPQSAYEIKCYMKEHKALGNTVFFSSHNIDMVEKLCDRVAIINKGELLEIVDIPYFMENSEVSLEEYFLNLTKDEVNANLKIAEENKKSKKERRKELINLEKEERERLRQAKKDDKSRKKSNKLAD